MPEVSIVIPVGNISKNLDTILLSLFTQSYPNFEIIIINNNCDSETTELIDNYEKFDNRIKVIKLKEKINLLRCCKIGAEYSRSNYITFLDSSKRMFFPQSALFRLLEILKNNQADFVYPACMVQELATFKHIPLYRVSLNEIMRKPAFSPKELNPEILFKLNLSIFGKFFKKEFFDSIPSSLFDETYFLKLFFAAKIIAYDDICLHIMTIAKEELIKPNEVFEQRSNEKLLEQLNLDSSYKEELTKHKIWKYYVTLQYLPKEKREKFSLEVAEDLKNIDISKYSTVGEKI